MSSFGMSSISLPTQVKPPIPESNTPIAADFVLVWSVVVVVGVGVGVAVDDIAVVSVVAVVGVLVGVAGVTADFSLILYRLSSNLAVEFKA
jgi:hypothetical protein